MMRDKMRESGMMSMMRALIAVIVGIIAFGLTAVAGLPMTDIGKPSGAPLEGQGVNISTTMTTQKSYNKLCQDYHNSPDWVWEPVQEVCIPCRLCEDSKEAYCQPCIKATTTQMVETGNTEDPALAASSTQAPPVSPEATTTQVTIEEPALAANATQASPVSPVIDRNTVMVIAIVTSVAGSLVGIICIILFKWGRNKKGYSKVMTKNAREGEEIGIETVPKQDHEPAPQFHPMDPNVITGTPPGGEMTWV